MHDPAADLDRLLRAAGQGDDSAAPEMPFAFDTRVLAAVHSGRSEALNGFGLIRMLQRIAIAAAVVLTAASAGAFWQIKNNRDLADSFTSAYVIADNAIDSAISQ